MTEQHERIAFGRRVGRRHAAAISRCRIIATLVLAVIVCGIYPAIVWGLAQALFHDKANGSLVKKDGTPTDKDEEAVGSALLGQPFSDAGYFHPRPPPPATATTRPPAAAPTSAR